MGLFFFGKNDIYILYFSKIIFCFGRIVHNLYDYLFREFVFPIVYSTHQL